MNYEITFRHIEMDMFRAGPEAYFTMLALTCKNLLDRAGGLGFYEFSCRKIAVGEYVFHAEEP